MDKSDQRVPVLCSKRGLTNPACPEALVRLFTDLLGPGEDKCSGAAGFQRGHWRSVGAAPPAVCVDKTAGARGARAAGRVRTGREPSRPSRSFRAGRPRCQPPGHRAPGSPGNPVSALLQRAGLAASAEAALARGLRRTVFGAAAMVRGHRPTCDPAGLLAFPAPVLLVNALLRQNGS